METQWYFDVDQLCSIRLVKERISSDYIWVDEIPSKRIKLLRFIPIGKTKAIPAGWSSQYGSINDPKNRYDSDYIKQYSWYKVQELPKMIFRKAHVTCTIRDKKEFSRNFESNEEALVWIDHLTTKSGKKFEVIIR
jgi:hypothetical protein